MPPGTWPEGKEELVADLEWLGIVWNDGPVRQSDRVDRYLEAAQALGERFDGITLVREDGRPTYHLASVVDDVHYGITHVIRGNDHRWQRGPAPPPARSARHRAAPEYIHHGLVLGPDGKKLSKRNHGVATVGDLREQGIPPEAVRAYLEELDLPRHDVQLDLPRIRRLAIDAIETLSDEELAARAGAPPQLAPALRGARDLVGRRERWRRNPAAAAGDAARNGAADAGALRRAADERAGREGDRARAEGGRGDLKALRLALTGAERGPELWTVIAALPQDEALRRVDAAL